MLLKTVDLYEYFGFERPGGGRGYLRCMCLDVTQEVNPDRRYPVMLVLPGGAYAFTSERESEPLAFSYMRSGYSAFILDYSVAPCKYPVSFREAAMAMVYIRKNAEELHIAPDKIAALGCSAGGHLLGCLTALYESNSIKDIVSDKFSARPDASVFCYPVITMGDKTHEWSRENLCGNNMALADSLSIEKHISGNAPPAFIWSTFNDESVPVENSLMLASAYKAAGVPFELHVYGSGVHGMSTGNDVTYRVSQIPPHSAQMPAWVDMSISWLRDIGMVLDD